MKTHPYEGNKETSYWNIKSIYYLHHCKGGLEANTFMIVQTNSM